MFIGVTLPKIATKFTRSVVVMARHGREVQELFEERLKRPMVNYQNVGESEGMETLVPAR